MESPYLLDKEISLRKLKELLKYVNAARECFIFIQNRFLYKDSKNKCEKMTKIGYGRKCLHDLDDLLFMEKEFISNYNLRNFDLRLGFDRHGFPCLGSWQADADFIKENQQGKGKYGCYDLSIDREKLSAIKVKQNYLCFTTNELNVCFSYSNERFVMTDYSNFCLIVLPKSRLRLDRDYFEYHEAPKNFYDYGYSSGLRGMNSLDYWEMVGLDGKALP